MSRSNDELNEIADFLLRGSELAGVGREILPISGDASGRSYYRIVFKQAELPTMILMLPVETKGPIVSSKYEIDPNTVFIELSSFLNEHDYRVPKIYSTTETALLIEDAGDSALWQIAFEEEKTTGKEKTFSLFKKALDLTCKLQAIPFTPNVTAFERSMQFEQYRKEDQRFIDYYLIANNYSKSIIDEVSLALDGLCESVASHPKTLMHRDFMPWNIHVLPTDELMVIDYQDMLMGSSVYDAVSLIHDRDIDGVLGDDICAQLAQYFLDKSGLTSRQYHEAVLQRYIRLAGQFYLLSKKLGKDTYKAWIPGCLKRIGRSLPLLSDYAKLLDVLSIIPEITEGASKPWEF